MSAERGNDHHRIPQGGFVYNAERMGTISVISSTPVMPMLVLSVIPESYCDHGLWEAPPRLRRSAVA